MLFVTTKGYFGSFALQSKRVKEHGPDGRPIYTDSLRVYITRTGVDKATKRAQGVVDTNSLPPNTVAAAKRIYGKDVWKEKLEAAITEMGLSNGLHPVESGMAPPATKPAGVKVITGTRTVTSMKPQKADK